MIHKVFKNIIKFSIFLLIGFGFFIFQFCQKPDTGFIVNPENKNMDTRSITEYAASQPDSFSYFLRVLDHDSLTGTLSAHNPKATNYTLFLPTNEAMDRFINNSKYSSLDDLLNDTEYAMKLGKYHIVSSQFSTNDFPFGALPDTTGNGDFLTIGFDEGRYNINNYATIIKPNILLINGYIHVINSVLQPVTFTSYQWLKDKPEFSIFGSALDLTGLNDTLNNDKYKIYPAD